MSDTGELALDFEDEPTFTVGQLATLIGDALSAAVPGSVWVRGEISQLRVSGNGHAYFELVEKGGRRADVTAVLRVALFRNDRATVNRALHEAGVRLEDGVEVRIRGRLDFYPPQGRLQLVMHGIDPVFTVGRMAADRERIVRRLAEEGLLRANGARPMPSVPLRIGLVTSGGSAAFHDFVHELETSGFAFRVVHSHARVQGAAAERRVVYALRRLAALDLDAVVVVRGGGSRSDLNAFDTEVVARAIAGMPFPVVTGIGHEVDRTIADEVAHTCAKTPTAAAGVLIDLVAAFDASLDRMSHRVVSRTRAFCGLAAQQVDGANRRLRRLAPAAAQRSERLLGGHRSRTIVAVRRATELAGDRLDARSRRVAPAAKRAMRDDERELAAIESRVRALDPKRVLQRGYSITRAPDGRVVRSAGMVGLGTRLHTEVADGIIASEVIEQQEPPR